MILQLSSDFALKQYTPVKVASQISNIERAYCFKFGRLVIAWFTFTTNAAISNNNATLFSGLPKAMYHTRTNFIRAGDTNYTFIRVGTGANGELNNAYSVSGIPVGTYEGEIVYFTSE